jgi:hypothetical protein
VNAAAWLFTIESWAGLELLHALRRIASERVTNRMRFFLDRCVIGRSASYNKDDSFKASRNG